MVGRSGYEYIAYPKLNHVKIGFVEIAFRNPHFHRELEIGLVLNGSATLMVGRNSFLIQRGSLYYINPNEAHNIVSEDLESVRIVYIQVSSLFCQEYFQLFRNLEIAWNDLSSHVSYQDNHMLTRLLLDVCRSYIDDGELSLIHSMKAVCELFSNLLAIVPYKRFDEAVYQARKRKMTRIQRITDYINVHYSEKLSLTELAAVENVSVTHLSHFIHDNLDMSFQNYVENVRLEKAVHLITNTSLRLTDICLECGFSDIKYLNKAFKKRFNCLPREYRSEFITDTTQGKTDGESQFYASENIGKAWLREFQSSFEDN